MTSRSARLERMRGRRWGAFAAVLGLLCGSVLWSSPAASAAPTLTPLSTDSFSGATTASPNWKTIAASGSANPCLTASSVPAQTPIGGCAGTALDAAGAGTLRLTNNATSQGGTVYNTISIPTTAGIDVAFNTYQYNGSGADGIAFILAAADPSNPAPPSVNGPVGGSLGYSSTGGGVSYGYLGFGIDVYGNFSSPGASGAGCPATSFAASTVAVRGPGNGSTGYCLLNSRASTGLLDARGSGSRPAPVPVRIALNPTTSPATTTTGLTVPASSWLIAWTSLGSSQQTMTGALPTAARLTALGFPAAYVNPTTGLPYQLTFGWSAATGGATEIHEVNQLSSTTLTGQLPAYQLSISDDQGGRFVTGGTAIVSVTPSLDPAQGSESEAATVTTTFPAGLTPATPTGSDYTCTRTGQVVSCRYTPTAPLAAGASLPVLQIPVTVTAAAGSTPVIDAKVSSVDGNPKTATRTVTVAAFTAAATPATVPYGSATTLSVSGLPTGATGTVTFRSGTTDLCGAALPATSCSPAATLLPATYPVTASYSGDGTHPALTATTTFTVSKATAAVTAAANSATVPYGTAQTLTAAVAPIGATGAVTFRTTDGTLLCTIADIAATTSCAAPTGLEPGTYTVTAGYAGDNRFTAATSVPSSFTVVRAAAPLTAAVAAAESDYGTPNVVSVSGLPAGATGTVTVTAGDTSLCTIPDVTAADSCVTPAGLNTGSYPVLASYSGDVRYESATAETAFVVTPFPTVLAAGVSDEAVPFGTTTTLTWSGMPAGATGTVTFTAGGGQLCTVDITTATGCPSPATLPGGRYDVTAAYSGDDNHDGASATTAFTVTPAGVPTFAAGVSDDEPTYGTPVTLSYSGLPAGATGSVVFRSAGDLLCTISDVTVSASCAAPIDLAAGGYPVTATYSGDRDYAPADADTTFTVARAGTDLTAAVSAGTTPYGTPVVLSFAGLPPGATGTVTFTGAGGPCTVDLTDEILTCPTPTALPVGTYPLTATYSGDANHLGSTGTTTYAIVPLTSPDFAAAATPVSTPFGTPTVLSFAGLAAGATGTVTFTAGDATLCSIADVTTTTSCSPPATLPVGSYPVTAAYSGDTNRAAATDDTSFDVVRADVTPVVSLGQPTIVYGTATTLTVTGLPAGATGSVTFTAGDRVLCAIADITAGPAACLTPAALPAGSYPVVATYSGDGSYNPAVGIPVTLVVEKAPSTVAVAISDANPVYGNTTSLSLTGLPAGATGPATFTSGTLTLCTIDDVATQPSCDVPAGLTAARYIVDGVWSGDANHLGSTAAGLFQVQPAPTAIAVTVPDTTYGQATTPTIAGLPAGAGGTVTLTTGDGTELCLLDPATAAGCEAVTGLAAGSYTVTAVYTGDINHQSSTATTTFTVGKAPTAFTVAVPALTYGDTVVPELTGLPDDATGTVTFTIDGEVVCVLDLDSGTGCEDLAATAVGDATLTAVYSGDARYLQSTATTTVTVARAQIPVVATPAGPVPAGGTTTLTVSDDLPADATGTVTFVAPDGTVLCTVTLPDRTCDASAALSPGSYDIRVLYSGDTDYAPSETVATLVVTAAPATPTTPVQPTAPTGGGSRPTPTNQPLAYTGTSISNWISGGALLLTIGGLLLLGSRRRATRQH